MGEQNALLHNEEEIQEKSHSFYYQNPQLFSSKKVVIIRRTRKNWKYPGT